MFDIEFYRSLPSGPDEAILQMVDTGLARIDEYMEREPNDAMGVHGRCRALVAAVSGAAGEIGMDTDLRLLPHENESAVDWQYQMRAELESIRGALAFRTQRASGAALEPMTLTPDFRDAIRGHTRKIRGILNLADIDADLRQDLLSELTKFECDLDRERSRVDGLIRLWMKVTKAVGDGAKNLEPVIDQAERIGAIFGGVLGQKQLPKPAPKLAPPKEEEECPI